MSPLALDLGACEAALAAYGDAAYRRYGRASLGVIDLPSLAGGSIVPEQVRIAGVLYWAGELDRASLVSVVEELARAAFVGSAPPAVSDVAAQLVPIFRNRRTRLQPAERQALLAGVHGGLEEQRSGTLQTRLLELADQLIAIGAEPLDRGISSLTARASYAATELASVLSQRAVGMSAFAAREILGQVREALGILRLPQVRRAFGNGSWLTAWQLAARQLLGLEVEPTAAIARAVSGQRIITWLAVRTPLGRTSAVVSDAAAFRTAFPGGGGSVSTLSPGPVRASAHEPPLGVLSTSKPREASADIEGAV